MRSSQMATQINQSLSGPTRLQRRPSALFFSFPFWPRCADLGREVTDLIILNLAFWFYLRALDVKLILLIIDNLLVKISAG